MSLLTDIGRLFTGDTKDEAPKLVFGRVEAVTGWRGYSDEVVTPGTHYFQWWLQEMWLRVERDWLNHYHPLVYSVVKFRFGDRELELPASLGKFKFQEGEDLVNLQDALLLNHAMTPPLPYNGGAVELAAALVGVRNQDGLSEIIDAVGELGGVLAIPPFSSVATFAGPIAKTLDSVMGQGQQRFELGLHETFQHQGEEEMQEGYFVAAHHDGPLDLARLLVNDGRLAWKENPTQLVREFDYMLFRLEMSSERDDLTGLTSIFDSVLLAQDAAIAGRPDEAASWLQKAGLAAFRSPDLTVADRKRLPKVLRDDFDEFLKIQGIVGDGAGVDEDTHLSVKDRLKQIDASAALALQDDAVVAAILER